MACLQRMGEDVRYVPALLPPCVLVIYTIAIGDMIYFEVLGQRFLVLNNLERVQDLFEKRSSNYSDRMRMPMVLEL
jgi:hypothetical protein